ncbi:phage tail protein [Liquorilactobacillus nagelii]|uniref:phage tail protein n=1 Tax=Liquorilactobacillus nagelii TaxID=82688 RepID=UPI0039EAC18F
MYRIVAFDNPTDNVGKVIFDLSMNKLLSAGKLTLVETGIDNAELTVNIKNPLFSKVQPFQTHINILQDSKLIFRGRALKPTRAMTSSGLFQQTFTFESILSYLYDSVQRFKEVHNTTPAQFFADLINVHNSQVPAYKQFKVGKIDVTNSTDNVYRYVEYETTYDTIKDKLLDRLGGYLVLRIESDGNYLDYLQNSGSDHQNDTPILLGKNLKSSSVQIDPTAIITRLVPLGATIESTDENNTSAAYPRVTISSVNDGKDYIDIPGLQSEFGVINGTQTWEDVNDASILLTKAKAWIASQKAATESWTVEAVELLNNRFESFKVSDRHRFTNDLIAEQQYLRVIQKDIDFTKPQSSSLTIGDSTVSLSRYQLENQKAAKEVSQLNSKLNTQQNKIVTLSDAIKKAQETITKQQDAIKTLSDDNTKISETLDELAKKVDSNTAPGVATEAVNGDWTPVIKYAAYLMEVALTDSSLATIKARIQQESGGSETIVNTTDSNAQAGHPSIGLLQYIQPTFDAWCLEGYTTITKGFHQLLAMFNDSNWFADISVGTNWDKEIY